MNRWEVHNAVTYTNHSIRPIVIINDRLEDGKVDCLLCGHDEMREQKDGSWTLISEFYNKNPKFEIKPFIVEDPLNHGFTKPSYVNTFKIFTIKRDKVDEKVNGILSDKDINDIRQELGLDSDDIDDGLIQLSKEN